MGCCIIISLTGKHHVNQVDALVPFVFRPKHDNVGHMAAEKTTTLIRREYFWLTVVANVRKYCHSCDPCACNRPAPSHPSTRFTLSSHQQEPWHEITMDIKRPLWQEMYHRYVLVVMDLLTREAKMIPILDKPAKTVLCRAVVHQVFCRWGIPESVLTDQGCEFDNQALSTVAQQLGLPLRISALHRQGSGNVEKLNPTIGEMLKKATDECGDGLDLEIPFVQFNYRSLTALLRTRHFTCLVGIFHVPHDCFLLLAPQGPQVPSTSRNQPLPHV